MVKLEYLFTGHDVLTTQYPIANTLCKDTTRRFMGNFINICTKPYDWL